VKLFGGNKIGNCTFRLPLVHYTACTNYSTWKPAKNPFPITFNIFKAATHTGCKLSQQWDSRWGGCTNCHAIGFV